MGSFFWGGASGSRPLLYTHESRVMLNSSLTVIFSVPPIAVRRKYWNKSSDHDKSRCFRGGDVGWDPKSSLCDVSPGLSLLGKVIIRSSAVSPTAAAIGSDQHAFRSRHRGSAGITALAHFTERGLDRTCDSSGAGRMLFRGQILQDLETARSYVSSALQAVSGK